MSEWQKAIEALQSNGVAFVIIGGIAMGAQGSAHVTYDMDICYERSPENVRRLAQALAPYHPRLRGAPGDPPFQLDQETLLRGLNFTLVTDLGDLDLLGEVAGLGAYSAVLAASEKLPVFGKDCNVLTLDGLIRSKRAAGRRRDLEALHELEALRELRDMTHRESSPNEKPE